jgi:hypothetical protein
MKSAKSLIGQVRCLGAAGLLPFDVNVSTTWTIDFARVANETTKRALYDLFEVLSVKGVDKHAIMADDVGWAAIQVITKNAGGESVYLSEYRELQQAE